MLPNGFVETFDCQWTPLIRTGPSRLLCAGMPTHVPVGVGLHCLLGSSTTENGAAHPPTCGSLGWPCVRQRHRRFGHYLGREPSSTWRFSVPLNFGLASFQSSSSKSEKVPKIYAERKSKLKFRPKSDVRISMHTLFCRCCRRVTTAKVSLWHPVGCLLRWSLGVTSRRLFAASLGCPHHPKWGLFAIWGCGTRRRRRGCGWTCAGLWTARRPPVTIIR